MRLRIALRRVGRALLLISCAAFIAGCATLAPVTERKVLESKVERNPLEVSGAPQAVAVVPARYAPESNFATFARGAAEGALKGGAGAAASVALLIPQLWPLCVLFPGVLAGIAGIGLIAGAAAAVPVEQAAAIEQMANTVVAELRLPELTAKMVAANVAKFAPYRAEIVEGIGPQSKNDAPDYRSLRERGFGAALEVRLNRIGFAGAGGMDPEIVLFVVAEARLVDTATGRLAGARGLYVESPRHKASVWAREAGALAKSRATQAFETVAERIVDDLVLQADFWIGRDALWAPSLCGLASRVPKPEWEAALFGPRHLAATAIESRTPELAWEGRPSPEGARGRASWLRTKPEDFVYDLRIWNAVDGAPGQIVYERLGLPRPEHQVETELAPAATHFWSVRARYSVDGHPRALRWSASNAPRLVAAIPVGDALYFPKSDDDVAPRAFCHEQDMIPCGCLDFIPTPNFYRFRTP